ncbi:nucleotide-binding universal stress UspA family protein [Microbacterium sp. AK009]|uniref:universal stress protein n=1 Tax=Microbacterium sp. AK009 TaxID=2723068 RepID=UPI0015C6B4D1|nr:universal stress protein [Microbacterium sp. AK009]NYF17771.1 nucleotide-binding universal stress UspA family protein [Microbacterium sp. AK009]
MESIVLAYDGSPASVAALAWVATRAARSVVGVDVVTVISRFTQERGAALRHLGDAEAFLRERVPGIGVQLHRLEGGVEPALTLMSSNADIVVLGITLGHPVRAALSGALPLTVSARSRAPVVLVPADWSDGGDPVTVGVSADDSSDAAVAFAAAEADLTSVSLRLVHAWQMPPPSFAGGATPTLDAVMAEHRGVLDTRMRWVIARYPSMGLRSDLVRDLAGPTLLRHASHSSLLVIGTHHRGLLQGRLSSSVAQDLVWRAPCPIAVVPAKTADDEREED